MMRDLVDKVCVIEFVGEPLRWPHPFSQGGFPARALVLDVDMPMVKLAPFGGGRSPGVWVSASQIVAIRAVGGCAE